MAVAALMAALLTMGLAGCGSQDVHVSGFTMTSAGRAACGPLVAHLPAHVADQDRRTTTGSTYAAAWGDPAIVLRCGVPRPAGFDRSATCLTRNGVGWFVPPKQIADSGSALDMTLVKHQPRIRVHLPAHYRPYGPSEVMADLAKVIGRFTKTTGHCH